MELPVLRLAAPTAGAPFFPLPTAAPPLPQSASGPACPATSPSYPRAAPSPRLSSCPQSVPPDPYPARCLHGPTSGWGERRVMRYEEWGTPKTWHACTNSNSVRASPRFKAMYLERSWGVLSVSMGRPAPPATGCGGTVGPEGWCRARARPLGGGHAHIRVVLQLHLDPHRGVAVGCVSDDAS